MLQDLHSNAYTFQVGWNPTTYPGARTKRPAANRWRGSWALEGRYTTFQKDAHTLQVDPVPGDSTTIQQLVASSSNSLAALVGGQVVPGLYISSQLSPGLELNTTDIVRDGNGQNAYIGITVAPASINGPIKVWGLLEWPRMLEVECLE